MMDFSQGAGQDSPSSLIPNGQLAFAIMTVRGVKASKAGGQYLDVELTIDDNQPYARKKLWDMIGDPGFAGNSPEYREMGMRSIARILETGRNAGPNNPAGYQLTDYAHLSGLRVAIKIGVTPAKDGYEEKNKVAEYLTPNPQSSASKDFQRLLAGEFNKAKTAAPAATGGFGRQQQPATGGFGSAPGNAFAAARAATSPAMTTSAGTVGAGDSKNPTSGGFSTGFTQPNNPPAQQGGGFAQPGFTQTTAAANAGESSASMNTGFAAPASATTSPSDAGPGWLQQAQQ